MLRERLNYFSTARNIIKWLPYAEVYRDILSKKHRDKGTKEICQVVKQ